MARITEARLAAHRAYQEALLSVFDTFGFTAKTLAEIERTENRPVLTTEAENALNAIALPKGLQRVVRDIYPTAPTYPSHIQLGNDTIFLRLAEVEPRSDQHTGKLVIVGENSAYPLILDPLLILHLPLGDLSYFKYTPGGSDNSGRDRVNLSLPQLRELAQLPKLIAKAPVVYASSFHFKPIRMG